MFPELNDSSRKIQPKCGPILGLLRILVVFHPKFFQKACFYIAYFTTKVRILIMVVQ